MKELKEKPKSMPKEYLLKKGEKSLKHTRGNHSWVAHCDEGGNERWSYCECCGKIWEGEN